MEQRATRMRVDWNLGAIFIPLNAAGDFWVVASIHTLQNQHGVVL